VWFSYPARAPGPNTAKKPDASPQEGKSILKGISFRIPPGKTLAVVGSSGSGKTTMSRLLCRFYVPQMGTISVDGQDITTITSQSLRQKIGVVPQDTVLFNDTIHYNILYGSISLLENDNVSESVPLPIVEKAAKEANIHQFIESCADKYLTRVGERGNKTL
jgi:ABC-type multidrug transport system fused ATPase/permease subunit